MATLKTLHSPDGNAGKETTLTEQEVQTRIKEIIIESLVSGWSKKLTEDMIKKELKKLNGMKLTPQQIRIIQNSLIRFAQKWYYTMSQNIKITNQEKALSIGISLDTLTGGNPTAIVSEQKFRGFVTDAKKGLTLSANYQKLVRQQLRILAQASPKVLLDKNGTQMSARNYAEMTVRHSINMAELDKFKEGGTKLVFTSSHADCSARCQKWQGKLFSLDGSSGVVDGIPYEPIENALNSNNGNSIVNGYNCRHYLIEYVPHMKPPRNFNEALIKKERQIDQRQRNYENRIRQLKTEALIMRKSGDNAIADKLTQRSVNLQKNYEKFSLEHNRAFYRWRTQVMKEESDNASVVPNKETKEIVEDIRDDLRKDK